MRAVLLDQPDLGNHNDENAPMMAVHHDLDFRAIETCQQWQGELR